MVFKLNLLKSLGAVLYCSLSFACHDAKAELAVVSSDNADLFQHKRRVDTLRFGEIVRAKDHKTDPEWLTIKTQEGVYLSHKKNFLTHSEFITNVNTTKALLKNTEASLTEAIEANYDKKGKLYACILQIDWDQAALFRIPIYGPNVHNQASENKHSRDTPGLPGNIQNSFAPRYRNVEKISSSKARRIKRDVENELKDLEEIHRTLTDKRLALSKQLASKEAYFYQLNSAFQKYSESPRTYRQSPYLVIAEYATLYKGVNSVGGLHKRDIVIGEPNRDDTSRLRILKNSKWYDSPAKPFRSQSKIKGNYIHRTGRIKAEIRDIEEKVTLLHLRETLYNSYIEDLSYFCTRFYDQGSHLQENSAHVFDYAVPALYSSKIPEYGSEVINPARARRTIKKWRKELNELKLELENQEILLTSLHGKLTSIQSSYDDLLDRFDTLMF